VANVDFERGLDSCHKPQMGTNENGQRSFYPDDESRKRELLASRNGGGTVSMSSKQENQEAVRGASAFEIAQIMGWSDIRMAMRYTHATGDGLRRAMQLLTQNTGTKNSPKVGFANWTDAKVPTVNQNGQHALPVSV